jgi:hypothetical protein
MLAADVELRAPKTRAALVRQAAITLKVGFAGLFCFASESDVF